MCLTPIGLMKLRQKSIANIEAVLKKFAAYPVGSIIPWAEFWDATSLGASGGCRYIEYGGESTLHRYSATLSAMQDNMSPNRTERRYLDCMDGDRRRQEGVLICERSQEEAEANLAQANILKEEFAAELAELEAGRKKPRREWSERWAAICDKMVESEKKRLRDWKEAADRGEVEMPPRKFRSPEDEPAARDRHAEWLKKYLAKRG